MALISPTKIAFSQVSTASRIPLATADRSLPSDSFSPSENNPRFAWQQYQSLSQSYTGFCRPTTSLSLNNDHTQNYGLLKSLASMAYANEEAAICEGVG